MTSIPLFPFTKSDISHPQIYESMPDFLHALKQLDVFLGDKAQVECYLIERRKNLQNYFLRFAVMVIGRAYTMNAVGREIEEFPRGNIKPPIAQAGNALSITIIWKQKHLAI